MRQIFKKTAISLSFLSLLAPITSCSQSQDTSITYVYVLNAEDYIDKDLITSFENKVKEESGKNVKVVYETYDTNETMYNTLKTGKQTYDLVCCSDYMIQRLVREGLALSFENAFDNDLLTNYKDYVSPFLADYNGDEGKLNEISVEVPIYKDGAIIDYDLTHKLTDYAVGYMWGTLGILYNPELIAERNKTNFKNNEVTQNFNKEEIVDYIKEDFNSLDGWSALWDPLYKGTQSIKDSMRDTYAVGILEYYKKYFDPRSEDYIDSLEERNERFNMCDDATIRGVQNELIKLKDNIFGFEVDSGKDDIVTKKIGVNIAWSGDAVNSIGRGYYADNDWEEVRNEEDQVNLYYALPELGANVWFDAWTIPSHDENYFNSDEYKYSMEFLNYLNDPENSVANMSYNGYTSFIGSNDLNQDVLSYIYESYYLDDGEDYYDISYYFNFTEPFEIEVGEEEPQVFSFKDEDNDGIIDIKVKTDLSSYEGRSLTAQLPEKKNINSLYVMRDFNTQNNAIVSMWENVKVNPLPIWIVVVLIVFLVGLLGYLGSYKLIRNYKLKKRKELRKENLDE